MTAFAGAASALLISVVLPQVDRRRVMTGLALLAVVSNLLVALASNLFVLLVARVLLGLALGGFWSMATVVAACLVHPQHLGRALTLINTGVSLSTIAAVPLGAYLGDLWGWRWVFAVTAAVTLLGLLAQVASLPQVQPEKGSGLQALGTVLRSGVVLTGLLGTLLVFTAHFGGFTYIRPAVQATSYMNASRFALLLLVFGLANLVGTVLAGPLADRSPRLGLLLFPSLISCGVLLLFFTDGSTPLVFFSAILWGCGFGGIPTSVLSWAARTQPTRIEQVSGVVVTVCSLGVALGAAVGGVLVDGVSATSPLALGAVISITGGLLLSALGRGRTSTASS